MKTNELFWDCNCATRFIHLKTNGNFCIKCQSYENDCPDSRTDEINKHYDVDNDKSIKRN
jgi:hypothetical protein